jgi:hypothetical protein
VKGLFLNVRDAAKRIEEFSKLLGIDAYQVHSNPRPGLDVHVAYFPADWPQGPVFHEPSGDLFAAAGGWFFYKGKLGNLEEFARDFMKAHGEDRAHRVAAEIEAGAFLLLVSFSDRTFLITDHLGLFNNYGFLEGQTLQVAPAPSFLDHPGEKHPLLESILDKQNHLFGRYTAYKGVFRLEPGCIIDDGEAVPYVSPDTTRPFHAEEFYEELSRLLGIFGERRKILPLSGGLDSRLLLAYGRFEFGYTFGPEGSGDRPTARRFGHRFAEYREFSLLDLIYPASHKKAGEMMLDGLSPEPFLELVTIYKHVLTLFGGDHVFVDGHLGDVLQRGTYLSYPGLIGHLSKLFPVLYRNRFDPMTWLLRRYGSLSKDEQEILVSEYDEKTRSWDLDPMRKMVLFEILHGRGSRHIAHGAGVMSNQFFTTFQPLISPKIFQMLLGLDQYESVAYRNLPKVWSGVPREFTDAATSTGFKPLWPPWVSRVATYSLKTLATLRLTRRLVTYEYERNRVVWEDS